MNPSAALLKTALRIPSTQMRTRFLVRPAASALQQRPMMSAAAAAMDDELYQSPISEYFSLAVKGVSATGTTMYRPSQSQLLKCGIAEDQLRFETASYGRKMLAPHVQPHEHKVTLSVHQNALPLNELEKRILKEIVGSRLNDDTGVLRLMSNTQGSRIENKRHLTSMLDRIVFACRKLAKEALEIQADKETAAEDSL